MKNGKTAVAIVIPKGFGDAAGSAFFGNGEKPALGFLYDPSRNVELAMVRGVMTQHVMEALSREMFGGQQGRTMVERTLPQIEASTSMPANDKRLLIEMLGSVQKFYSRPEGTAAASQPRGITKPSCSIS